MKIQALLTTVGLACASFGAGYPSDLVYYSKLDSAADITAPQVGAAGEIAGTVTFGTGCDGNAALIPANGTGSIGIPFPSGLPVEKGRIEFDAKLATSEDTYGSSGGNPAFLHVQVANGGAEVHDLAITGNDGSGHSGLVLNFAGTRLATHDTWGIVTYSSIYGDADHKAWHHYSCLWNTNGIAGSTDMIQVYIDDELKLHGALDPSALSQYASAMGASLKMFISKSQNYVPFYLDEFKVWKTDTPPEGPVELPVVSEVTAKQHYPWCGKVDIGYTVAGSTDGLKVKITVKDNTNDVTYEAKTFNVDPTAAAGAHTVVWDATADGVNKVSKNMVATVSLIVPAN